MARNIYCLAFFHIMCIVLCDINLPLMAGHNKWSKVKHKKAVTDARKSKEFSKFSKLIMMESKQAGGDRSAPGLKAAIEQAKQASMPMDNIERAIQRGVGVTNGSLEEIVYETYGPGGVAILIYALTDNRNRTASEVKHTLTKHGYTLAEPGAASWAFTKSDDGNYTAHTTMELAPESQEKLEKLVNALEELDDTQAVYTNAA